MGIRRLIVIVLFCLASLGWTYEGGWDPGSVDAERISVDVTSFDNNLSSVDTDVQKALETVDELVVGTAEADTLQTVTTRGNTTTTDIGIGTASPRATLEVYASDAEIRLSDNTSEYSRWTRAATSDTTILANRVTWISPGADGVISKLSNVVPNASDTTSTSGRIPLGTDGTGDDGTILSSCVILDGSTYKMWYTGYDGSNYRIYYATSSDGLSWTKYDNSIPSASDTTSTNGRIPLGISGAGDDSSVRDPFVLLDGATYRMWYTGISSSGRRIYYATSSDGLTWTKYDNSVPSASDTSSTNGRIPKGTNGKGDDDKVEMPSVLLDGSTYKMWYLGNDGVSSRIYYATSPDCLTWTKYDNTSPSDSDTSSTNGRIPKGTSGHGDSRNVGSPFVILDGSTYKMWYFGEDSDQTQRIYYATSSDGLTWTKLENATPSNSDSASTYWRIPLGSAGKGDSSHVKQTSVLKDGSSYRFWYVGASGSSNRVYYSSNESSTEIAEVDVIKSELSAVDGIKGIQTFGDSEGNTVISGSPIRIGSLTDNGFVKTSSANGTLTVDTITYLSSESDTFATVTSRGNVTTANVGIGTTAAPTNTLSVTGTANVTGNVSLGTTNVNGSAYVSGNLGIGTTVPLNKLDINGNIGLGTGARAFGLSGTVLAFDRGGSYFTGYNLLTGASSGLVVNSSGNVGIGTTVPSDLLEIKSGATGGAIINSTTAITGGIDSYVKTMLHMDGTDASTTFTDSAAAPHTYTAGDNAQIDTAQSVFGGASGLFDGTGDYITTPDSDDWDFWNGNFTIDFRIRFNSVSGTQDLFGQRGAGAVQAQLTFASNVLTLNSSNAGGTYANYTASWTPSTGVWYHVEVSRDGNTCRMFIDGSPISVTTNTGFTTSPNYALAFEIGRDVFDGQYFNGWIDEFRLSKGICRHSSGFTIPSSAYNNDSTGSPALILQTNSSQKAKIYTDGSNSDSLTFDVASTPRVSIGTTGSMGIGTTVPLSKLELIGVGTTNATSSVHVMNSARTSVLKALDNGNVGIGTTVPSEKLEVNGNIVPSVTATNTLGTDALRWSSLYVSGSSLHIGATGAEALIGYDGTYLTEDKSMLLGVAGTNGVDATDITLVTQVGYSSGTGETPSIGGDLILSTGDGGSSQDATPPTKAGDLRFELGSAGGGSGAPDAAAFKFKLGDNKSYVVNYGTQNPFQITDSEDAVIFSVDKNFKTTAIGDLTMGDNTDVARTITVDTFTYDATISFDPTNPVFTFSHGLSAPSLTDNVASWTSNSLSGFTSISGTTITDGVFNTTGGAVTVGSITDNTASWSSSTLSGFTSISGTTITDGSMSISAGILTVGSVTLSSNTFDLYGVGTFHFGTDAGTNSYFQDNSGSGVFGCTTGSITLTSPSATYILTGLTTDGFVKTSGGTGTLTIDTATYISAEADTLDTVADRGATTDQSITALSYYVGTTNQALSAVSDGTLDIYASSTINFQTAGPASQVYIMDGVFAGSVNDDIDLGSSYAYFKDEYLRGTLYLGDGQNSYIYGNHTGQNNSLDIHSNATIDFYIGATGGTSQLILEDGLLHGTTDSDIDLGSTSYRFKNGYFYNATGTLTAYINDNGIGIQSGNGTQQANFIDNGYAGRFLGVVAPTTDEGASLGDDTYRWLSGIFYNTQGTLGVELNRDGIAGQFTNGAQTANLIAAGYAGTFTGGLVPAADEGSWLGDSSYRFQSGQFYNTTGTVGVQITDDSIAGQFTDGTRTVNLANGSYAMTATGGIVPVADEGSFLGDATYRFQAGQFYNTTGTVGVQIADDSIALQATDGTNTANLSTGTYGVDASTINSAGTIYVAGQGRITTGAFYTSNNNGGATSSGAIPVYNDGTTSGQLTSITIEDGIITAYTVIP